MNINKLETGQRVEVLSYEVSDNWLFGTVSENEYLKDKFIQLENGEEVFDFQIDEIKPA